MIANLEYIKGHGMTAFLKMEEEKWKCPECGGVVCVGARSIACSDCGLEIKRIIKDGKKYRLLQVWTENKIAPVSTKDQNKEKLSQKMQKGDKTR